MQTVTNLANIESMTDEEFIRYAPRGQSEWLDEALNRLQDLHYEAGELAAALELIQRIKK